ncbi:MAG: sugar transferase [Pirellulales bacterium]|nr:sugar transferase [Pirellulales bacterium]
MTIEHSDTLLADPRHFDATDLAAHEIVRKPRWRTATPSTRQRIALFFQQCEHGDTEALLVQPRGNLSLGYQAVKRVLDICGALIALALFAPIMLSAFVALCFTTKGRPLYAQTRVGRCGRPFRMYKFRSMRQDADQIQCQIVNEKDGPIFKNRRDPRITRIGRFIRSTSIDEMPQLFNVLLGDMSLVGPRPPVPKEVVEYRPWQLARLSVKPGLTCLWQVSGRSEVGFEDWVRMDIWYIQNQSLWTDVQLLWRTPLSVLSRRGAY